MDTLSTGSDSLTRMRTNQLHISTTCPLFDPHIYIKSRLEVPAFSRSMIICLLQQSICASCPLQDQKAGRGRWKLNTKLLTRREHWGTKERLHSLQNSEATLTMDALAGSPKGNIKRYHPQMVCSEGKSQEEFNCPNTIFLLLLTFRYLWELFHWQNYWQEQYIIMNLRVSRQ